MTDAIISRVSHNDMRYYKIEKDNNILGIVPSVTSIIGNTKDKTFLIKWRERVGKENADKISSDAMLRGTVMHKLLEIYLNLSDIKDDELRLKRTFELTEIDEEINIPEIKQYHKKIGSELFYNIHRNSYKFFDNIDKVFLQEQFLWINNGRFAYAGTVDNVSYLKNGNLAIIDFKTAKAYKRPEWIADYRLQIAAYAIAFWNLYNIRINAGEIWISNEKGGVQRFTYTFNELSGFFKEFMERLDKFYELYPRIKY